MVLALVRVTTHSLALIRTLKGDAPERIPHIKMARKCTFLLAQLCELASSLRVLRSSIEPLQPHLLALLSHSSLDPYVSTLVAECLYRLD